MEIIVSRPTDDETIVDVYLVEHDTKSAKDFDKDWFRALTKAKRANPETWNVNEVVETMEYKGWRILCSNPVFVTY
jgi:hypothetical protein